MPEEDRFLMTEDEIRGQLVMLLGGRAAEELMLERVSTGASDDIQKATDLAERFVTLYGMSPSLGPLAFERPQQAFLEGMPNPRRTVSPAITEAIDRAVKGLVDEAHEMALRILANNRSLLEQTAQTLLEHEVLEAEPLQNILQQVKAPTQLHGWLCQGKRSCSQQLQKALQKDQFTPPPPEFHLLNGGD
jgi:cell division protease FtsH